ncbi:MAG: NADH-quinone oxidoreductase subunit L, partial [Dehalococcoidia bacterium]
STIATLSILIGLVGIVAAGWFYWGGSLARSTALAERAPGLYEALQHKFYFDEVYQYGIDRGVLGFSYLVSWFDRYVVNDTGVDGSAQVTGYSGFLLRRLQTGRVPNYALAISLGVVGLTVVGLVLRN